MRFEAIAYLHQKIFCKIINIYYLCTIITFIFNNNNNRILHPTKHILFPSIQGGVRGGSLC